MTKPIVYIIIYSLYHHVYNLSLSVKEGLEKQGVDVQLFQVQETLSDDILAKMQAREKLDLPFITVDKLSEPDGILFGFPTRFGTIPAQMKAFLDASGALWAKGALAGKFVGTFFSTASQHGGQETTALTTITYFAHHGMLYVPFGFANSEMNRLDQVVGGSAYGAGTIANGDGSRQPTEAELSIAVNQGINFGNVVTTFVKGRDSVNSTIQNKSTDVNGAAVGSNSTDTTTNTAGTTTNAADTTNNTAGDGVPTGSAAGTDIPSGTTTDNQHKGAAALGAAAAATGVGATGAAITAANSKNKTTVVDNDGTINNSNVASTNNDITSANNNVASVNDNIASTNNGVASTNNGVASTNNGVASDINGVASANNNGALTNDNGALANNNGASAVAKDKTIVGASVIDNKTSAALTNNPSANTAAPNSNAKVTSSDLPATSNNPTTTTDPTNNTTATNVHPVKESRVETNKAKDKKKKSCFCM